MNILRTTIRLFATAVFAGWALASGGLPVAAAHAVASTACTAWTISPTPNITRPDGQLNAVAATSSGDVWAVGTNHRGALIEHFDGTHWSIVPGTGEGRLCDPRRRG
jgi:hypothetical protein